MDLHQKVPCPEDFLQSIPIAKVRRGSGLLTILLCYKSRQQRMPLVVCVFSAVFNSFKSADKKFKVLLSGCIVPLQSTERGVRSFPRVPAVSLLASLGDGHGGRGSIVQSPASISAPHFPQFHLLLAGARDLGKSCLLLLGVLASSSGIVPCRKALLFP